MLNPLYVDGPLAGKEFPVSRSAVSHGVHAIAFSDESEPSYPYLPATVRQVVYRLHRYRIFGRIVWIATLKADPEELGDDIIAEYLLSDRAKLATDLIASDCDRR